MSLRQMPPAWLPSRIGRALAQVEAAVPMLYLAWMLPLGLVIAVLTPPWQNPDEASHMLRIAQIAHGGWLSYKFGQTAGGITDPAILQSLRAVLGVFQHHGHKVSLNMLAKAGAVAWGTPAEVGFPATARYGPFLYLPAALAVALGRLLHLSVVHSLIAARMANVLTATLIGTYALALARRTRLALLALLMLPMTLALLASAAEDAMLTAVTLAIVGFVDRIIDQDRDPTGWEELLIGGGTLVLVLGRPTNLLLAALPLVCAWQLRRRAWFVSAAVAVAGACWVVYVMRTLSVPLLPTVDTAKQSHYLLHQPWMIAPLMVNTLAELHEGYIDSFIGVLGTLDTPLPQLFYHLALATLLLAYAAASVRPTRRPLASLLIALAMGGAIFLSQYLTWTPPHAGVIEGVEGRHLLAPIALLALAVPAWPSVGQIARPLAIAAVLGLAAITPMIIVHALVLRYYLGA